jgi:hypothetical protein
LRFTPDTWIVAFACDGNGNTEYDVRNAMMET